MKLYLAGGNRKKRILQMAFSSQIVQVERERERHAPGDLIDNLSCGSADGRQYPDSGAKKYSHDAIVRGGFNDLTDEDISCRKHDLPEIHISDNFGEGQCDCSWLGSPRGGAGGYDPIICKHKPYILESFYYVDADTERLLPHFGDFLLDSGAFTFCGTGGYIESKFEEYLERYADFIKRNKVEKFFELDVDSITGYEKVLYFRRRLESMTGKQCIPVWHISRGKEEFLRHCDEYPYVALGGYVAAIKASDPKQRAYVRAYPWFIQEAHKRDAKIHGLGFTQLKLLEKYHFDSVDSTTWTTGNRYGYLYFFNGRTMIKKDAPKGHRIIDSRAAALHNYTEWIKYQKYAETHL